LPPDFAKEVLIIHRFFIDNAKTMNEDVLLTGQNAAHANVLRLNIGEGIVVCDGRGWDYYCAVIAISRDEVRVRITHSEENTVEPSVAVTLFQALPKGDKMDDIVERCVELGITSIVPVVTARCIARPSSRDAKKTERWRKIALSAAKQSHRGIIPHVAGAMSLDKAIMSAKGHGAAFVCYEMADKLSLKDFLQVLPSDITSLAYFIGPEGGFAPDEIIKFAENSIPAVSLGRRILRTQTAASAVLANVVYELEAAVPPEGGILIGGKHAQNISGCRGHCAAP